MSNVAYTKNMSFSAISHAIFPPYFISIKKHLISTLKARKMIAHKTPSLYSLYTSTLLQGKLQKPMKRQRLMQQQQHNRLAGISSKTKLNLFQLTQGYQHHQIFLQQHHKPRQKPLFRWKLENEDSARTNGHASVQQVNHNLDQTQHKPLNFADNFKVYSKFFSCSFNYSLDTLLP